MPECGRDRRLELHTLMVHRMIEAEHIGVQAEPVQRVIAVAVLHIAADRMPHVGRITQTARPYPVCRERHFRQSF